MAPAEWSAGCGAGRDAKVFNDFAYQVCDVDASEGLARTAE